MTTIFCNLATDVQVTLASFPDSPPAFCTRNGERAWKISSHARWRWRTTHDFKRGFGNRIIAQAYVNRCDFNRAGDLFMLSR